MNSPHPRRPALELLRGAIVAASVCVAAGLLLPIGTAASTGITITSGTCSGSGTLYCYGPESATVQVGTPVTWTNQSGTGHTATSCTPSLCAGAPANTGSDTFAVSIGAANGSSGSFTFTHAGTYTYFCTIHGYAAMHGTITVTAAPATASAGATASPSSAARGAGTSTPSTGAAPGPLGAVVLAIGMAALALVAAARRR
jgi:plastocyanin